MSFFSQVNTALTKAGDQESVPYRICTLEFGMLTIVLQETGQEGQGRRQPVLKGQGEGGGGH
jgi:hypothetical protein